MLIFEWSNCSHRKLQWLRLLEWCWWPEVFFCHQWAVTRLCGAGAVPESQQDQQQHQRHLYIVSGGGDGVPHQSGYGAGCLCADVSHDAVGVCVCVCVLGGGGGGEYVCVCRGGGGGGRGGGGQCSFCQVEETVLWVVGRGEEGSVLSWTSYTTPLLPHPPNKPNKVDWGCTAIRLWCWLLRLMYRVYLFHSVSVWLSWILSQYISAIYAFQSILVWLSWIVRPSTCLCHVFFFSLYVCPICLCWFTVAFRPASDITSSMVLVLGRQVFSTFFFLFFFTGLVRESERFGRHVLQVHSAVPEPQQTPSQRGAVWPALDVCWPLQRHPHLVLRSLHAPRVLAEVRWLSTLEYSTTPLSAVTGCPTSAGRGKVAQYTRVQYNTSFCSHCMHHECWQR